MIDATHDLARKSWIESANGHGEFPIQNLPLGVFSPPNGKPRGGVAIGDFIFDIAAALQVGLFTGAARDAAEAAAGAALNPLLALGAGARRALRQRVSDLLDANGAEHARVAPLAPRLLDKSDESATGPLTPFAARLTGATHLR